MQSVVTNTRELPGLSRFLLPPLFSDLQRASSGRPVVILNASRHSCDALVILIDRDPVHIPLQITQENVRDLSRGFRNLTVRVQRVNVMRELALLLRELWEQIVSSIVDALQTTHPFQSRIWWCPTADFISSCTPTLTALIRARQQDPSNSVTERKCFVTIGQAETAGKSKLLFVGAEGQHWSVRGRPHHARADRRRGILH